MYRVCGNSVGRGIDLLPTDLVDRMLRKRGRPCAFERLGFATTALAVIDMTNLFVGEDADARAAAGRVNHAAAVLRAGGGTILWVRPAAPFSNPALMAELLGEGPAAHYRDAALDETGRNALYPSLEVDPDDLHARKTTYSAFFPGACDAAELLRGRRIDTVLIAGIVADVCCEASARDAYSCGFRVVALADAMVGSGETACLASLAAIHRNFGDVRLVDEALDLLR